MLFSLVLWAQAENQGGGAPAPQTPVWFSWLPIVGIFFLFYLLLIRPMRRQEQERQRLAANLERNDKVLLSSGIYATVLSVSDEPGKDEVTVKVDDNVKLRIIRGAIMRNLTKEETHQKALAERQAAGS